MGDREVRTAVCFPVQITMRKIFLYHQWQYEKAEKFLSDMESHGYRLKRIRFSFWFEFAKVPPKKAGYIFLYSFVKDSDCEHYEACKYLLGSCGGSQVCGKSNLSQINIWGLSPKQLILMPMC